MTKNKLQTLDLNKNDPPPKKLRFDEGYWLKRWRDDECWFHLDEPHDVMVRHLDRLLPRKKGRVFVPLCGKTVDMKFLADAGHDVIGLELAEQPILEFFDENKIDYDVTERDDFVIYSGGLVRIYQGDLFKLDCEKVEKFDAIWDRGSFVAINPEERRDYVTVMTSLMHKESCYLLNAFTFKESLYKAPPHSMTDDEVIDYFSNCDVTALETIKSSATWTTNNYLIKLKETE